MSATSPRAQEENPPARKRRPPPRAKAARPRRPGPRARRTSRSNDLFRNGRKGARRRLGDGGDGIGEQAADPVLDGPRDLVLRALSVEDQVTRRLRAGQREELVADPAVEGQGLGL